MELWAAICSLGRRGVREMIERNCQQARLFAELLQAAGFAVLNDVVLNQVLVSFGSEEETRRGDQRRANRGNVPGAAARTWQGKAAMRISVSNWSTTDEDIERSAAAIIRVARS